MNCARKGDSEMASGGAFIDATALESVDNDSTDRFQFCKKKYS